jgi:hypothetical protein
VIVAAAIACGVVLWARGHGHRRRGRPRARARSSEARVTRSSRAIKTELEQLLERYVTDDPTPNAFYQVQPGDTPIGVASAALGADADAQAVTEYLMCIASGPNWNMPLYGTPSTSKKYPASLLVPGVQIGVRVAFLPRNEDALGLMLKERSPRMSVHAQTGESLLPGDSYGLLWLPPVADDFSCAGYSWEDGSSAIDPPPAILERLS